jgi:hypothetical protein
VFTSQYRLILLLGTALSHPGRARFFIGNQGYPPLVQHEFVWQSLKGRGLQGYPCVLHPYPMTRFDASHLNHCVHFSADWPIRLPFDCGFQGSVANVAGRIW